MTGEYSKKNHFFETYGPFKIPIENQSVVRPGKKWWDNDVGDYYRDWSGNRHLRSAIGCYMFTMGNENIRPWYIGKTVNQNGFQDEAFTEHKIRKYNKVIFSQNRRGPAQIYFFPLITGDFHSGRWSFAGGKSHDKVISWLEKFLIGMAYSRNKNLTNVKDATFLKTVLVRGIVGSAPGAPHGDIGLARLALLGKITNDDE